MREQFKDWSMVWGGQGATIIIGLVAITAKVTMREESHLDPESSWIMGEAELHVLEIWWAWFLLFLFFIFLPLSPPTTNVGKRSVQKIKERGGISSGWRGLRSATRLGNGNLGTISKGRKFGSRIHIIHVIHNLTSIFVGGRGRAVRLNSRSPRKGYWSHYGFGSCRCVVRVQDRKG